MKLQLIIPQDLCVSSLNNRKLHYKLEIHRAARKLFDDFVPLVEALSISSFRDPHIFLMLELNNELESPKNILDSI